MIKTLFITMTAKKNTNITNLMSGALWFVDEMDDGSNSPISLKEFKTSIDQENPSAELSRGRVVPKNEKQTEQQLTFDCAYNEENSTFKLSLFEDGTVSGNIEFPLYENEPVQYFKGDYLISNSKITIWGVWSEDIEFEELFSVFIEFKKIKKHEEIIYDETEAVEFIRENISDELSEKLNDKAILKLLDLEEEYIEIEFQKNEKNIPFVSFDLKTIDQDDVNDYVFNNAVLHNIILNIEEIEEVMYAEIGYLEEIGLIGDNVTFYN